MKRILIISNTYTLQQRLQALLLQFRDRYLLCGTADNSVLGMNLIESTVPDIVIMPAYMNFWNAEDLINYLTPKGNCPVFILLHREPLSLPEVISGKIAAVLPSEGCSDGMLTSALDMAVRLKEAETPIPSVGASAKNAIQHSLEVMELLMGLSPLQTREAQQKYGRLRVGLRNCWLILGHVDPHILESYDFFRDLDTLELLFHSIVHLLRPLGTCEVCIYQEENLCILLEDGQQPEPDWNIWIGKLNQQLEALRMPSLLYEVSDMPYPLNRWHQQCKELIKLRSARFFFSPVFLQPRIKKEYEQFVPQSDLHTQLSSLSQALQSGRISQIEQAVQNTLSLVCSSMSRDVYSYAMSQMVLQYHQLQHTLGVDHDPNGPSLRLRQYKSAKEFFLDFLQCVTLLLSALDSGETDNPIVSEVYQYIHRNLAEPLTLESLAGHVHVTAPYLSRLFKRETGVSLNTYINRQRVEKAKQLLSTTQRITDIAGMVGFDSSKYFSQVFKKITGNTPQEFRQALQGGGTE